MVNYQFTVTAMEEELKIPCYVDGKMVWGEDYTQQTTSSGLKISHVMATDWMIEAAIETAARTQILISKTHLDKIFLLLNKTMAHYFKDHKTYETFVNLTGSPYHYIYKNTEELKNWCANIQDFYKKMFNNPDMVVKQTKPTVVILPNNSDEETVYVLAQTILSRNAAIVRPSSKNEGSFVLIEFVDALNKAIDELNDPELEAFRSIVSVLNIPADKYLPKLAVDGWNYIVFGDDSTNKIVTETFKQIEIKPRKIIGYGAGLSSTIIFDDFNWDYLKEIAESISVNRGNECVSTDIIYVQKTIAEEFFVRLQEEFQNYKSGNPFDLNSIGLVSQGNIQHIEEQAKNRAKIHALNITHDEDKKLIHTSSLSLHRYESAMEYPGPIVSIRGFDNLEELHNLIAKDLRDNDKEKNLVSSVYTEDKLRFIESLQIMSAYKVKHNNPTHTFDPFLPHQGIFLLQELVDPTYLENRNKMVN